MFPQFGENSADLHELSGLTPPAGGGRWPGSWAGALEARHPGRTVCPGPPGQTGWTSTLTR